MSDQLSKSLDRRLDKISKDESISQRNRELIIGFHRECFAHKLTIKRILKYMTYLPKLSAMLEKDFDKITIDDMKDLVITIEKSDYAERSKYDLKGIIKKFYQWVGGFDWDSKRYPESVCWIKSRWKESSNKLPEDLLTPEEVRKMIEASNSMRDKTIISVLYEAGIRIGEMFSIRIKSVSFDDYGCVINVFGKTGSRRVRLVASTPYVANWMEHHPSRNDPESCLWICTGTMNHGKPMSYNTVCHMLQDVADKCGIKKKVNPHNFRHSRATHLASHLTEAQMKEYFGWYQGSKMASIYVHMSGRDVDNAILSLHGIKKPEDERKDRVFEPKKCPRCEKTNEFEARICCRCGMPLDSKAAMDLEEEKSLFARAVMKEEVQNLIKKEMKSILRGET
jgi:site-specific recombinase XerD